MSIRPDLRLTATMRALVADGRGGVAIQDVEEVVAGPNEVVVAVRATSLNRGEVKNAKASPAGTRVGWDVAGEVVAGPADGTSPPAGARVVGLSANRGWAERVAVPASLVAALPGGLSFEDASTLPVAGLTALHALRIGGSRAGARVLVTGAAGGVGRFAVQLAAQGGADVTAVVGSPERGEGLAALGAGAVVVGMPSDGPFDVVLESVGGASLAQAVRLLAPDGTIVSFGNSAEVETTFNARDLYRIGGASIYGLILFHELAQGGTGAADLGHLAGEVAAGRLRTEVDLVRPWERADEAVEALMARRVRGKVVLTLAG
jgi:NADPH:quinone reductase-like Zn-dependent oxidoreductase